ncbi:MAG TPA: branched-chain amino acid ABC transporter permease, partial [Clostridia bacterium]|nr:branched-chain amino acid ABC transporter permease [Clostridia bacterium]
MAAKYKKLPTLLRYAINLALFAAFLIVGNLLIEGGAISKYYAKVVMLIGINVILAVSLNVATGYLGQLPLGHAGFMAVGAYASAVFMTR